MPLGGGISKSASFYGESPMPAAGLPPPAPIGAPLSTTPGTVPGTAPSTYNPAVGGIPSVPDPLKAIQDAINAYTANFSKLQALANQETAARTAQAQQQIQAAIQSAIANQSASYGPAQSIANQINAANQAAAVKQVTDLYPQFTGNVAQLGADIADWSSGRISSSTVNELTRRMGERGIAGGFGPNTPATNAALMALLGKTSEALQGQALTGQNTLLAGLPKAPLTSASSFMLNPNTLLTGTLSQMGTPATASSLGLNPANIFSNLYNAQLQAALYRAAPDPASAFNLAMEQARQGLNLGGAAGRGPYAGTPTTGSTSSPEILKLLQDLINRGSGTSTGSQTSAYYNQAPYVPTTATEDSAIYGSPENLWDYLNFEGPYAGDYVAPPVTTPTLPPDEQYWNDFYFNATNPGE